MFYVFWRAAPLALFIKVKIASCPFLEVKNAPYPFPSRGNWISTENRKMLLEKYVRKFLHSKTVDFVPKRRFLSTWRNI